MDRAPPPPRKELQGHRPAPLKIHKDSHKIRKPPIAPEIHHRPPVAPPPRQPVIIYAVSPKVIHANPSEFMNLVQRLTGLSSSAEPATTYDGSVSPAARYAATERANTEYARTSFGNDTSTSSNNTAMELGNGVNYSKGFFSGILSPGPGSLQPISPGFFSSAPSDTFFNDLMISPVIYGGFTASPVGASSSNSFFVSPRAHHLIASPTIPSFDHLFFNNIFSDHNL